MPARTAHARWTSPPPRRRRRACDGRRPRHSAQVAAAHHAVHPEAAAELAAGAGRAQPAAGAEGRPDGAAEHLVQDARGACTHACGACTRQQQQQQQQQAACGGAAAASRWHMPPQRAARNRAAGAGNTPPSRPCAMGPQQRLTSRPRLPPSRCLPQDTDDHQRRLEAFYSGQAHACTLGGWWAGRAGARGCTSNGPQPAGCSCSFPARPRSPRPVHSPRHHCMHHASLKQTTPSEPVSCTGGAPCWRPAPPACET